MKMINLNNQLTSDEYNSQGNNFGITVYTHLKSKSNPKEANQTKTDNQTQPANTIKKEWSGNLINKTNEKPTPSKTQTISTAKQRTITKKEWRDKQLEKANETNLITYIKVLLEAQRSIPNIVKILDEIIKERASTLMPTYTIYGAKNSTYSEINKVIDLSARKDKLLRLYTIARTIQKDLNEEERTIMTLRYINSMQIKDISSKMYIPERTIYRMINRTISKMAISMLDRGWDSGYIIRQIGSNESWLTEIYERKKKEEAWNKARKFSCASLPNRRP